MNINIKINGVDKLVRKFEKMPGEVKSRMRSALEASVEDIREYAQSHHRFISRGGQTEKEGIQSSVDGLTGTVRLATDIAVWQHEGTRPHIIRPKVGKALRFLGSRDIVGSLGFVFVKQVRHPGIKPDHYLYNAADHERPAIVSRFEAVIQKLCEEI